MTPLSRAGSGDTPLHAAIWAGDDEAARQLIDAGADVNAAGEDGYTPIHAALAQSNVALARRLTAVRRVVGRGQRLCLLGARRGAAIGRSGGARAARAGRARQPAAGPHRSLPARVRTSQRLVDRSRAAVRAAGVRAAARGGARGAARSPPPGRGVWPARRRRLRGAARRRSFGRRVLLHGALGVRRATGRGRRCFAVEYRLPPVLRARLQRQARGDRQRRHQCRLGGPWHLRGPAVVRREHGRGSVARRSRLRRGGICHASTTSRSKPSGHSRSPCGLRPSAPCARPAWPCRRQCRI